MWWWNIANQHFSLRILNLNDNMNDDVNVVIDVVWIYFLVLKYVVHNVIDVIDVILNNKKILNVDVCWHMLLLEILKILIWFLNCVIVMYVYLRMLVGAEKMILSFYVLMDWLLMNVKIGIEIENLQVTFEIDLETN